MSSRSDAHLLIAQLHRSALLRLNAEGGVPFQGLSMGGNRLCLSNSWKRKLRTWDAALGLAEKISPESVDHFLDKLDVELARVRGPSTTVHDSLLDAGAACNDAYSDAYNDVVGDRGQSTTEHDSVLDAGAARSDAYNDAYNAVVGDPVTSLQSPPLVINEVVTSDDARTYPSLSVAWFDKLDKQVVAKQAYVGDLVDALGHIVPEPSESEKVTDLYFDGLPHAITPESLMEIFRPYGALHVALCLNTQATVAFDKDRALWMLNNMNGNIPLGLQSPISVMGGMSAKGGMGAWGGLNAMLDPPAHAAALPVRRDLRHGSLRV